MLRALSLFLCTAAVLADPEDPVLPPADWPSQHTHLEVRFYLRADVRTSDRHACHALALLSQLVPRLNSSPTL